MGDTDDETQAGAATGPPRSPAPAASAAASSRAESFRASLLPPIASLEKYFVHAEADWPLFFIKVVAHYGITFAFVLMCAPNARRFFDAETLRENDARELAWTATYPRDRDLLEQHIYTDLRKALAGWTDVLEYFDDITPAQPQCARRLCDAILDAFPIDDERLQHQLLIRALRRSLRLNVTTSDSFNKHCSGVRDDMRTLEGMTLSVPHLLAAITTSLCEAHSDTRVNDAFHEIQDAVENGQAFDFKLVTKKVSKHLKKKRAGSRSSVEDSDALALRSMATPTGPKCQGCHGCSLHCVDTKSGKWRAAPSARNRGAYLTFMGEHEGGYDSLGEPNYPDVEHAALQRVDRAAGEARAMITAQSFGHDSSQDEGDSDY